MEEIARWQARPLDRVWPFIFLDALVIKVRDQGVVQNKSAYLALGVGGGVDGRKEILGLWLESTEGAKFWLKVSTELKNRGVEDVFIACCDGLKGFPQAIEAVFPKTIVQTCIVHVVRSSTRFVSWKDRKVLMTRLRLIYGAPTEDAALTELGAFETEWKSRYPIVARAWRENWESARPFFAFPLEIRRLIYTTNAIESLNAQLRKIIKSKGHFPSDEAATKLLYLALRNVEKKWRSGPIYWKSVLNQLAIHFDGRLPA